jgi:hypothetical protein
MLDERGFAGAIFAHEPNDRPLWNAEADFLKREFLAKSARNLPHLHNGRASRRSRHAGTVVRVN